VLSRFGLSERAYLLATVHRSENTNDVAQLSRIFEALDSLEEPIVFPVHPRTRKMIGEMGFRPRPHLHLIDPVGYLDMVAPVGSARSVLTASGGLQRQASWLVEPCVTLQNEWECVQTLATGWA